MTAPPLHIPVMLSESVAALAPRDGGLYVDGTFGAGGYTAALLGAADCRVIAIDRDPDAVARGAALAAAHAGRVTVIEGRFGELAQLLAEARIDAVDGVTLDLGVSSPQLDDHRRGFSFRSDGPLDMRMAQHGPSAADLVNTLGEADLADVIFQFGEERFSRRVARRIVEARTVAPILRTQALAAIVRAAVPASKDGIDPATRTFQALRIAVNDELGELGRGLDAAAALVRIAGRIAVVAFHSLEDRIVKQRFRDWAGGARPSRHQPLVDDQALGSTFRLITRKALRPGAAECAANPRARSARLRAIERVAA